MTLIRKQALIAPLWAFVHLRFISRVCNHVFEGIRWRLIKLHLDQLFLFIALNGLELLDHLVWRLAGHTGTLEVLHGELVGVR